MFQTTNQIWILNQNECLMDFYESGSSESKIKLDLPSGKLTVRPWQSGLED